jgi:arginase family enzyme
VSTKQLTATFCGVPAARMEEIPPGTRAAIIGAGHRLGTPHAGAENGPYFLRIVSKMHTWAARSPQIVDLNRGGRPVAGTVDAGDVAIDPDAGLPEALAAIEAMIGKLPPDVAPALIGGDHTVTLAAVNALAARRDQPFDVVQFDHHLDVQIWDGAPGRADVAREDIFHTNVISHVADRLGPGRVIQIGVAPFVTVETPAAVAVPDFLRGIGVQVPLLSPLLSDPEAFRATVGAGRDVYVTVDVDVLDHTAMSSTGYPAPMGLGLRELLGLIDQLLAGNRLIGFDVVEFAAERDARDPKTLADAERAVLIVMHLLGWIQRQAGQD